MRGALWTCLVLAVAACGGETGARYAIDPGTYEVTRSEVVTDGCGVAAAYGAVGKQFEIRVSGDPRAYQRDVAINLDASQDPETWVTGTVRAENMGTSSGGKTYAASGACVITIGRSMTIDLVGDDQMFVQMVVGMRQAPFSPVACAPADFPAGRTFPSCITSLRLDARRR
jgi:hypothetical protein